MITNNEENFNIILHFKVCIFKGVMYYIYIMLLYIMYLTKRKGV